MILSPPFLILLVIFLFQKSIQELESYYSFYTWLLLIVFVDVAHVYSTLFKTYFNKEEVRRRRLLYWGMPLLSWLLGILLYQFGSLIFWSGLALIAVFHFIRQQYGFMRIYARFEPAGWNKKIDGIAVYAATIYPMLYWFSTPRAFNWFVSNEFHWFKNLSGVLPYFTGLYNSILLLWIFTTVKSSINKGCWNIPKIALITGTYLSWYFGIIYFNSDVIFTLLNVISHGVPYIALIYIREIYQKEIPRTHRLSLFKRSFGIILFILIIIGCAFFEELLWEVLVWKEHISFGLISLGYLFPFLVPLLAVPQLTHYLLDGFIWKKPKKVV